jgi:hypothetical protein
MPSLNTWGKMEHSEAVDKKFTDFNKAFVSVGRGVLYDIIIEFGISMKIVLRLITMCLNGTYSRVQVGKYLSDMFPINNVLKQGDALLPVLCNFTLEYAIRRV